MKFCIFILFLLTASILANNVESDRKNKQLSYSILVLGDIGQITEFEPFPIAAGKSKDLPVDKVKIATPQLSSCLDHKSPYTMENFKSVLTHTAKLSNIDETVILGDGVYTEGKNLGALYKELASDPNPNVPLEDFKLEMFSRLICGWETVIKIVKESTVPFVKESTSAIFGNHSLDVDYEVELNYLLNFKTKHVAIQSKTVKDLYIEVEKNKKEGKIKEVAKQVENAARELKAQSKPENANKANRVDEDENGVKEGHLHYEIFYPKVSWGNKAGAPVKDVIYIDLDMTKLLCGNVADKPTEYEDCADKNFLKSYPDYNTEDFRNSHKKYFDSFVKTMADVSALTPSPKWKIVRLHQPIFNPEADLNYIKKNEIIMNAFKTAGIHLWFVSHHHTAEVNISRFENDTYKYAYKSRFSNKNKQEFNGVVSVGADTITKYSETPIVHTELNDYWYSKGQDGKYVKDLVEKPVPAEINRCVNLLKDCTNKIATFYIKPNNNDYIIQLLSGNSGRKLDTLISDLYSDAYTLYARSYPGEYGYYTASFTDNTAEIKFYVNTQDAPKFIIKIVQDEAKAVDATNFKDGVNFMEYLTNKLTIPAAKKLKIKKQS